MAERINRAIDWVYTNESALFLSRSLAAIRRALHDLMVDRIRYERRELKRVECGRAHFEALGVDCRVVVSSNEV